MVDVRLALCLTRWSCSCQLHVCSYNRPELTFLVNDFVQKSHLNAASVEEPCFALELLPPADGGG